MVQTLYQKQNILMSKCGQFNKGLQRSLTNTLHDTHVFFFVLFFFADSIHS